MNFDRIQDRLHGGLNNVQDRIYDIVQVRGDDSVLDKFMTSFKTGLIIETRKGLTT